MNILNLTSHVNDDIIFKKLFLFYEGYWSRISRDSTFNTSEYLMDKYKNEVDWLYILSYCILSNQFIEKHINFFDNECWKIISSKQKLSEEFIEKYQTKLDWDYISSYQKLSEHFIEKYQNFVNWRNIFNHQELSEYFIEKYKNKITCWNQLLKFQHVSEAFIEKYLIKFDFSVILSSCQLSTLFIEKYISKFDNECWKKFSMYQKIPKFMMIKYKNKINWKIASEFQVFDEEFIKDNYKSLNCNKINKNKNISYKLKRKIYDLNFLSK